MTRRGDGGVSVGEGGVSVDVGVGVGVSEGVGGYVWVGVRVGVLVSIGVSGVLVGDGVNVGVRERMTGITVGVGIVPVTEGDDPLQAGDASRVTAARLNMIKKAKSLSPAMAGERPAMNVKSCGR
jgi:hypothetical protein